MLKTRDWAASVSVKTERAKEHINALESAIEAFLRGDNYVTVADQDTETGDYLIRVRVKRDPPLRWGAIAGDAIHNLRSALDSIVYQLCLAAPGKPSNAVMFPISASAERFEARDLSEINCAGQAAVDLIKAIKPYKGGNDALWALHRLDIVNKHHVLLPVGSAIASRKIDIIGPIGRALFGVEEFPFRLDLSLKPEDNLYIGGEKIPVTYPLKDGAVLYRVPAHMKNDVDMDPKFSFTIAFGEGEVNGQPIIPTLHEFAKVVDGIVEQFARLPIA